MLRNQIWEGNSAAFHSFPLRVWSGQRQWRHFINNCQQENASLLNQKCLWHGIKHFIQQQVSKICVCKILDAATSCILGSFTRRCMEEALVFDVTLFLTEQNSHLCSQTWCWLPLQCVWFGYRHSGFKKCCSDEGLQDILLAFHTTDYDSC